MNRQLKLVLLLLGCIAIGLSLLGLAWYPKFWSHPILWVFQEGKVYKFDPRDQSLQYVPLPVQPAWIEDDTPILSPDGRYLALANKESLITVRVSDMTLNLVVPHKHDVDPLSFEYETYTPLQWSPDSNWLLAYIWRYEQQGLALININTGKITEIGGVNSDHNYCGFSGAAWSPDSSSLVITNDTGIHCMAGGPSSPGVHLVSLESPKFVSIYSTAYATDDSSNIWHQDLNRSSTGAPAWQPNSYWVVFNVETGWMINNDLLFGGFPVYQLYRVNVDNLAVQPITFNTIGQAYSPIWDNSGEHLLFSLHAADNYDDGIYISTSDGSNPQLIIPGECFAPIALSPDNAYLVYGHCSVAGFQWEPYLSSDELLIYDFRTKESINLGKVRLIGWQIVQE